MQYVGQTCRKLKNRFGEHYRKIKKPKRIDTFLYQHFKRTGHSPDNILVLPVEKLIYDETSSEVQYHQKVRNRIKIDKIIAICFPSRI